MNSFVEELPHLLRMVHAVVVHVNVGLTLGVVHQLTNELLETCGVVGAANNLEVGDADLLADGANDGHGATP